MPCRLGRYVARSLFADVISKETPMPINISPNYLSDKLSDPTLDDLIDVFEDRVKGWVLNPAYDLLRNPHFRIASLCIQLTYFEGIWGYVTGVDSKNRSKEFFRKGFIDVFRIEGTNQNLLGRAADVIYEDARCGFFHDGMFRSRLFFTSRGFALEITLPKQNGIIDQAGEIKSIMIDSCLFYDAIDNHFDTLIKRLRNGSDQELIENFKNGWELRKGSPKIIGIDDPQNDLI
jgi:hypothetical protein